MPQAVGHTTQVDEWSFQENYVERLMDNAAFTAAHPNNTMVLAGPARFTNALTEDNSLGDNMLPVGMVQNMQVNQQRQVRPMQAIGSARTYFTASKSRVSFNISRLMVNGRNLLRALYTQAVTNNIDLSMFGDEPVRQSNSEQYFLNLDSELFYIPIGLAVLYRSVAHDAVGAFYVELAMINSWNVSTQAGQSMIMENVSGFADRVRPIFPDSLRGNRADNHVGSEGLSESMLNMEDSVRDLSDR